MYKYCDSEQRLGKEILVVGLGPKVEISQGQTPLVIGSALSLVVIVEINGLT